MVSARLNLVCGRLFNEVVVEVYRELVDVHNACRHDVVQEKREHLRRLSESDALWIEVVLVVGSIPCNR